MKKILKEQEEQETEQKRNYNWKKPTLCLWEEENKYKRNVKNYYA